VIDAVLANRAETFTVNVPNRGAIAGFDDDLVVEIPAVWSGSSFVTAIESARLPTHVRGLIEMLANTSGLRRARVGWRPRDGVRALAAHAVCAVVAGRRGALFGTCRRPAQWLPERLC